jgi:hypothetical protein
MAEEKSPGLIQLPCSICPEQFAVLSVDLNCSREAYHALQSKCLKPDRFEMDFDKLGDFMKHLYEDKYDKASCEWKMQNMIEWDAALEEVYVKFFE